MKSTAYVQGEYEKAYAVLMQYSTMHPVYSPSIAPTYHKQTSYLKTVSVFVNLPYS